jgi:hypothetical protein
MAPVKAREGESMEKDSTFYSPCLFSIACTFVNYDIWPAQIASSLHQLAFHGGYARKHQSLLPRVSSSATGTPLVALERSCGHARVNVFGGSCRNFRVHFHFNKGHCNKLSERNKLFRVAKTIFSWSLVFVRGQVYEPERFAKSRKRR